MADETASPRVSVHQEVSAEEGPHPEQRRHQLLWGGVSQESAEVQVGSAGEREL